LDALIPVVLFVYARPEYLKRTLECLKENQIPRLYAFCDGAKTPDLEPKVSEVRKMLHNIDWCEMHLVEREENLGLGKSIISGVTEMFEKFEMILVFEDDLVCVPGTYQYLCAALRHYRNDNRVMSVTGWTHPLFIPKDIKNEPYFDGRTECLSWGAWRRSWDGMDRDSLSLMNDCVGRHIDIYQYGADLVEMARVEKVRNIWAVRFAFLHLFKGGLCLRPPHSMVEHIGYNFTATNATSIPKYYNEHLEPAPIIPEQWPEAKENLECSKLWQNECGSQPTYAVISPSLVIKWVNKIISRISFLIDRNK